MKTHIFQAHTMSAAVAQVKAHLGPDAFILNTRTLRKGGLFSRSRRKLVEVTAAADGLAEPVEFHPQPRRQSAAAAGSPANRVPLPAADLPEWLNRDRPDQDVLSTARRLRTNRPVHPGDSTVFHSAPQRLRRLFESFLATHIAEALARQLLADLPADVDPASEGPNPLLDRIEKLIPTAGPVQPGLPGKPQVVSFIGPTGVGKTTSIAKLAARYKLRQNASVALLTIDTYRIAAVDQLRTYADIIDVPFAVIRTPQELAQQVTRLSDCSLIFIDTTGRSPNDQLRLAELRSFHQALGPHQKHLVLAATASHPQMIRAIENFSPLGIDQLLLTKLDEAVSLSPVLNVFASLASGRPDGPPLPLSYVAAGQDVPDDIEVASSRHLAVRILGEHRD